MRLAASRARVLLVSPKIVLRLFHDIDMSGSVFALTLPGRYVFSATHDNRISSLSVPAGWRVTLFDGSSFNGTSRVVHEGSYFSLGTFNDLASSAIVEEPAAAYMHPNFTGPVGKLLPSCFNTAALGVPDNAISSVHVPPGFSVTLFKTPTSSAPRRP